MATSVLCQLCQQPVLLENARINEVGRAVHEECYVQAIRIPKQNKPVERPKPPGTS
jgi:hypothetical protein